MELFAPADVHFFKLWSSVDEEPSGGIYSRRNLARE